MDTYARTLLLQLSGKTSFGRQSAVQWLARLLFAPATTFEDKVFLINNPETATALGVEPEPKRRYSFSRIEPGFAKLEELARMADKIEPKERSVVEQEILRVYQNVFLYDLHTRVFRFALPSSEFQITDPGIIKTLGLPETQKIFSFYDLASRAELLQQGTQGLELSKPETWAVKDKELFGLMNNLFHWSTTYSDLPFAIVPSLEASGQGWLSPMDAISREFSDLKVREEIAYARDMVVYYWNGEQTPFDLAARSLSNSVLSRAGAATQKNIRKIPLELFYNRADLFLWTKMFYALAFAVFLLSFFMTRSWLRPAAFSLIIAGFLPHVLALVLRIIIMARPPVSNLYETFIFVSMISVIAGVIIELVNRRWVGICVASVCGFVFLMLSGKFAGEGDTMQMLVAVLNSNFWLGTHVLSITVGYAGVCVAGLVGHLYILQRIRYPKDKAALESTYRNMIGALGFGLMMSFLGTTLGGIWADDSWGRFWGWDPKENGALLIVLWCAILFHARLGRFITPLGAAAGCVLGIVVVMWAWFGVNLLNVGLHSYGFTSGIATGLLAYVIGEVVFLGLCVPLASKKT
ncbi:MAG: ABC-type transport system involved in cytochrome c biogenesis, permease component [Candidatus Magasanikbacteria bacterium GW2011_GWA2_50_22]|uniref:ABC-type transport system involved in cytochrome c biogenesis, permease component n=1 Tax=Candidatus Magasanikbacteria bacterium GW2011_GWA2_50_22 TaxID=1619043 RepID=A0A0G1ZD49_9BACT|nr:MAG: ABC-type transport system involved in cytochrome c biogenesis, permease component [Candidatus Magasanikbacteria bacterium GW2011_GWA2_50_22]